MKFLIVLYIFSTLCFSAVKYNPDENTLWIEDGKNFAIIEYGKKEFWEGKAWSGKLEVEGLEDGFRIKSPSNDKHSIGRYFKFSSEYPYLVWEIKKVIYGEGYRDFLMAFPNNVFNFVTHIYPGLFVTNPFLSNKNIKNFEYCRIFLYNTEIHFSYIKMVKKPEYLIEIESPAIKEKGYVEIGDEIIFKVILKEPAEDVSLTFYDFYITHEIKVNNSSSLQLKPEDDEQKIWIGKIKLEKIDKPSVKKDGKEIDTYSPGNFLIKATVLGGKINVPIWTANYFEIKTERRPK
ncbi:MAG: hypothetical protein N2589_04170 [bacterium]|nr:hypothetical protein [bacterium]